MKAQALICTQDQRFSLEAFEVPPLAPSALQIRTLYSGISVGTEFAVIRGKLDWGPFPLCTGYQAVGVVETVGADVTGYQPGDKVYYRRNYLPMQWDGRPVNNAAGTHCSVAVIEPAQAEGLALLPEGVDEATASLFVMPAVGYNAVDMAGVRLGDVVAVQGAGPIGLGALVAAQLRGATTLAIDISPQRLALASALGADVTIDSRCGDVLAEMQAIMPEGADVVFEATGIPALLDTAFSLCRRHGRFVFLGNYGNAPISFHFLPPHGKQLTAFFPCNDGLAPCRKTVLKLIASGAIPWQKTISHHLDAAEAPAFYQEINEGRVFDLMAAVIHWA